MQWCSDGAYQSGYRGCTTIVMMKISFNFVFHKSLQRSIIIIEISGMRKEEYYTVYNSVSIFSHLFCHPRYISSSSRFLEDIFKKQSYSNSKWDVFENNGEVVRWVTGIIDRSDFSTLTHHFIKLNAGPKIIDFVRYPISSDGIVIPIDRLVRDRPPKRPDGTRGAKRSQRNEITINMVAPLSNHHLLRWPLWDDHTKGF